MNIDLQENRPPTKELHQFQKLIVKNLYIKYLNNGLDYMSWENEKKATIIENLEKENEELKARIETQKITIEIQMEYAIELVKTIDSLRAKNNNLKNPGKLLVRHGIFPK